VGGKAARSGCGVAFYPVFRKFLFMIKGQKVVCINDTFLDPIRLIYKQLPVQGGTYTIREVFLGREKVTQGGDSATVGLLLEELVNPPDPFHQGRQELGFSSERFAPVEELPPETEEEEEELVAGMPSWAPIPGMN
jgi:hypothetical protein